MPLVSKSILSAYIELTKPRILTMVLVTTVLGFALGGSVLAPFPYLRLLYTLIGTGLASGGAAVLNHYLEREVDGRMARTRNRPLPKGVVPPIGALLFGIVLLAAGPLFLWYFVNGLAAFLALLSGVLYVLVYTPMKRYTWLNTPMGAIPGAIPPMIGWAGARGQLDVGAWVLFFIMFLWQHPHFYSIAWMFRDDYREGGFKMLPIVQPDGKSTFRQSLASAILLIPVSLWPTFVRMSGWLYFFGALICGLWFLRACIQWRISESTVDARKVLRASVIYLPVLLLLILLDSFLSHLLKIYG